MLNETELKEITAVLKALSDPNRLRIFSELMTGDSCNNELMETLGLRSNLLSHHLRVLSEAGLVTSRRDRIDGRWIYYTVDHDTAAHWHQWFSTFFNPDRIQKRVVCGPEGQLAFIPTSDLFVETK
ncbi:MAG: winged helix-turn-helix transcriptional regulator [Anaerolineae bacterium]|nr:winged helix-turn-helix transcriptional regulator [Anaerolineae bacterium]